jgi:hypothetical protein
MLSSPHYRTNTDHRMCSYRWQTQVIRNSPTSCLLKVYGAINTRHLRLLSSSSSNMYPPVVQQGSFWYCVWRFYIFRYFFFIYNLNQQSEFTFYKLHADLGISYVNEVIHKKLNKHLTRLETQENPLLKTLLVRQENRQLERNWPIDLIWEKTQQYKMSRWHCWSLIEVLLVLMCTEWNAF